MIRDLFQGDIHKVPTLAFHTMNLCDDFIVMYGGLNTTERISGDLIFLKLNKDKFMIASYENNKNYFPKPRHSHSAVYNKINKRLLLFGGIMAENPKYSDELWSLDVGTKPKFKLISANKISKRCRHVSFLYKNKLYIYGGFGIDTITKKYQILNDMYTINLEDESDVEIREIVTKGGIDMKNFLFKVVRLSDEEDDDLSDKRVQYAFFCQDLSQFFIFDVLNESFTKIQPKFFVHGPRENFTVNRLSDGRIVLFGGMYENDCFGEAYILTEFFYSQKENKKDEIKRKTKNIIDEYLHFEWNDVDLYGENDKEDQDEGTVGFNGHSSLRLANDHILIFGGTKQSYFPVFNNFSSLNDPLFTRRCKILDIFNTYRWEKPIKSNADKIHLYPRVLHVSQMIPKESKESNNLIFFHGGEFDGKILCQFSIFDLDDEKWLDIDNRDNKEFIPQLKSHACSYIYDPERKEFYVIMMGGMIKEHLPTCEAETNKQKERCGCQTELITDKIFAYRNFKFFNINQVSSSNDYVDKLKRFGHNLITGPDGCIYMICGFAQYIGYLVDIIKFNPKSDLKNKTFFFQSEPIDCGKSMPGRIYATCQIIQNNIIVFGGLRDNHTLNDFWIINLQNLIPKCVDVEPRWIYPRFGMSSAINLSPIDDSSARIIIFGGSYWAGKDLVYGSTSEIVVFNLKFNDETFTEFDAIKSLPLVYGKGSRRVFHQSFYFNGEMFVFGGINNILLKLKMPDLSFLDFNKSIKDYTKQFPLIHYTSLLNSQEDEKDNRFDATTSTNKSKSYSDQPEQNVKVKINKIENTPIKNPKHEIIEMTNLNVSNYNDYSNINLLNSSKSDAKSDRNKEQSSFIDNSINNVTNMSLVDNKLDYINNFDESMNDSNRKFVNSVKELNSESGGSGSKDKKKKIPKNWDQDYL